jgi:superfamily II DNA or RNA helicase
MTSPAFPALTSWQQEFVDQFVSQQRSKSLLVAAAGSGKTMTALIAASKMLERESLIRCW